MSEETVSCEICDVEGIKDHMEKLDGKWYCEFHHIIEWVERRKKSDIGSR